MDLEELKKNRYVRFLVTKFMITFCFCGMLVFDFAIVVVLLNLLGIVSNYVPDDMKTTSYGYFVTQLSGVGGLILYIIFYIITLIASASLMREEIKDILSNHNSKEQDHEGDKQ